MAESFPNKPEPTVIGIGASAGGLTALKVLLNAVPADSGLALVVVVHLSPDHESHLAELLQPHVKIPVEQVCADTLIEPNHVYVIPPNANLNTIDSHLRLTALEVRRHERAPIDHFFRTLAKTHKEHAIAVILTGTGSDGTLGLKEIKDGGGLVVVQDPVEAEFDGMPQSALATGLVDLVLPLRKIPEAILSYHRTIPNLPDIPDEGEVQRDESAILQKILAQLRVRTDRDFSRYRKATVLRRIGRRMQLNHVERLSQYLKRLREDGDEAYALADDLLITVTHFFRDPEVFQKLATDVVPQLFAAKDRKHPVRVWSVGCASGEEAYSLAILLAEEASRSEASVPVQVFASDLHARSLERAREGFYSGEIETDVTVERLKRFFNKENGGYRIRKEIRDLVIFAPHNLLGDPPFSRLDLISCRNLLIYLERDVQHDVIELFHYALNNNGALLLGSAESIDSDLFQVQDKKLCFFRKRNVPLSWPRLPVFPLARLRQLPDRTSDPQSEKGLPAPMAFGSLHQQMLERYAPPSVLVSPDDRVVHLSEHAGRYLTHPGGEPTASIFRLVREELRIELQASLGSARAHKQAFDSKPVPVQFNGDARPVVLHVRPALEPGREGFVLVIFEEREPSKAGEVEPPGDGASMRQLFDQISDLETELNQTRERLRSIIEEYETGREEMKASSEEMQSANEELRSTMEELETSKEELQSINEELQTVNQQNRHKVEELAQLSCDLQNLLAATDIATLFLDRDLRIMRFTPKLGDLFNVRSTDRGRPISDLTHRLGYKELQSDAGKVITRLTLVEREVQDEQGRWYLTRVLPYRSSDDRIEGVAITFIDIDSRKRMEDALRSSEERLRRMINVDAVGVTIFDADFKLIDSNQAFQQMTGYSSEEVRSGKLNWRALTPSEYIAASESHLAVLRQTGRIAPYEKEYFRKDGSRFWMLFAGASLGDGTTVEYCIDISDRKKAEQDVLDARYYAESIIETLHEPLIVLTPDLTLRTANPAFYGAFQVEPEQTIGRKIYDLGNGQWNIPKLRLLLEDILPANSEFNDYEVEHEFEDIGKRVMLLNARRLDHVQLILLGVRDITEMKARALRLQQVEGGLRNANDALLRANTDLKHFSYAVSHDMQEPLRMVISYTQLIASQYGDKLDEKGNRFVGYAVEGARRMELLLRDLQSYWAVDDHKVSEPVDVDCNAVLSRALAHLNTAVEFSGASIDAGPLPTIRAEEYPLVLLFQNLISNAIKYRRQDVPLEIRVGAERSAEAWRFSISDNGVGIAAEHFGTIFAPFKRLHGREYSGTGLGLAMCQRVVERYHGKIWVESDPGTGSTFHFTVPA